MASAGDIRMNIDIDMDRAVTETLETQRAEKLREARIKAVQAMGMVWSDEAKEITREDDHIDTGLYVNSIGYLTNFPSTNKSGKGSEQATEADVINQITDYTHTTRLKIGSKVKYAEPLEKRYNIFARALDRAKPEMQRVADTQVKNILT